MNLVKSFLTALTAYCLLVPFAFADESVKERCGEPAPYATETASQLVCSLLQRESNPVDELYAISLIFWEYPIPEKYVVMTRHGDSWHLYAKAAELDYEGFLDGEEFTYLGIDTRDFFAKNVPSYLGGAFRNYLTSERWSKMLQAPNIQVYGKWTPTNGPEGVPQGMRPCIDGTELTAYRYYEGRLQTLYLHDCEGPSGLNEIAQGLVDIAIAIDPKIKPLLSDLPDVRNFK